MASSSIVAVNVNVNKTICTVHSEVCPELLGEALHRSASQGLPFNSICDQHMVSVNI